MSFVDVVNFTAMMAADEARTLARWMSILDGALRPLATQHGGTVVKSTGDGVLARFPSTLDAVEWAEAVQRVVCAGHEDDAAAHGPDVAGGHAPSRMEVRIAVHLGDIVVTSDDIQGDGVNVAARLLEHAAPSTTVLSEAVYDLVRGSAGARALDLGWRHLKSYERAVRVYALPPATPGPARRPGFSGPMPSIAVLPLQSMSESGEDRYFADGVVEDIIVSLAGLGELLVVSRATTLVFQGRQADPREVGRVLGVRYVLTGTLRSSPRLIRVGIQLCDAATGTALWTETAEVAPGDLFDMQDRIVTKIVAGIAPNVRVSELRRAMRKQPGSFTAYDHTLHAMHLIYGLDHSEFAGARAKLDAAIAEDPSFAMPFAWAAWWHVLNVGQGLSTDPAEDNRLAGAMAARSIALDDRNALALSVYGHVKSYLFHEYDVGLLYLERALSVSPNSALSWVLSSASHAYVGDGARAIQHAERGLRLSPLDRGLFFTHNILCLAHYVNGDFAEAVTWGRLSDAENPAFTATQRLLAASLVANGEIAEAGAVAARMLRQEPGFTVEAYIRTRQPLRAAAAGRILAERLSVAIAAA
ncbi:MAG: hypothetical protein H7Z10_03715 [Gemmatimonadaceae bacterium]|nr:hypothetical protein [Acetobacteraceae bacterium]